jgi:hypothetical protein
VDGHAAAPVVLFGTLSLSLHVAVFVALRPSVAAPLARNEHAAALVGATLAIDAPSVDPGDRDLPSPLQAARSAAAPESTAAGHPPNAPASMASRSSSGESRVARPLFGAVGVPFAANLSATFTRALPQASSADPAWVRAQFGAAGWADVTIILDETGHVVSRAVSGSPSPALRSSIERTLSLLDQRVFTAQQSLTRLRVTARVTRDDVHDGLHGDVFALSGGSFDGDSGSAFFALPAERGPGRRIDAVVRFLH